MRARNLVFSRANFEFHDREFTSEFLFSLGAYECNE
jgi:hypothetical protein